VPTIDQHYEVLKPLGQGLAGEVFLVQRDGRQLALKLLKGAIAHLSAAEAETHFKAEFSILKQLSHPNIAQIVDFGIDRATGRCYYTTEYIEGSDLFQASRGLAPDKIEATFIQALRALEYLRAHGIAHYDLKPENLLVTADGTLKILDFGLAKLRGDELDATEPGTVQGTVGYMAPEQARGEPTDARCDLFAAGAILYELATGRRAFDGASHAERLSAVLRDTPPLEAAGLGGLAPIVARCLEKDPRRRFQSAQDLAWVLEQLGDGASAEPHAAAIAAEGPGRATASPTEAPAQAGSTAAPTETPAQAGSTASPTEAPSQPGSSAPSRRAILAGAAAAAAAAALGFALGRRGRRGATAAAAPVVAYRQLTYRQGRILGARFRRDGDALLYGAAWDADPLAVYEVPVGGGVAQRLPLPSADILAISGRGELALGLGRRHVVHQCATGTLAIAPVDGGVPRRIVDDVQEADFAPDGALLYVRPGGRGFRLEVAGGAPLLDSESWLTHPRLAPDGRRVACLRHPSVADDRGELILVDRPGGAVRVIGGGWDSIAGLAWDPDGRHLWFTATRVGASNAVHVIDVDAPEAAPRLIAQTTGRLRLHDVAPAPVASAARRIAVTVDAWRLRTLVGRLASDGGAAAPEADRSLSDFSLLTDLSSDGRTLLLAELGDVEAAVGGYLRPVDGGAALRVGGGIPIALSPSGGRVAALSPGEAPLVIHDTASAARPAIALGPITEVRGGRWIDEAQLALTASAAGQPARIWRLTVGGAAPVPLTPEGAAGVLELDPARRRAAFVDRDGRLAIVDLATGALRALPGSHGRREVCGWLGADAIAIRTTTAPIEITRVDATSGAATPHATITPPPVGLRAVDAVLLRPDGSYAYSHGAELSQLFLMTVEGL
jgi:eukaryotic-like serine/threonine-protein kinase